ncbi:MAG: hypothetical protein RL263_349 [Bacteroidota bacterium]
MNIFNIFKNLTLSQITRIQSVCMNKCFIDTLQNKAAFFLVFSLSIFNFLEAQSFRGLHVISDTVVWVSGSKGQIWEIGDSMSWLNCSPKGYDRKDFRDIHAWGPHEAIAMSAGDSGVLIRTSDGGSHWSLVHSDFRKGVFFDAIDFEQSNGVLLGDPIETDSQHLYAYLSLNKGLNWIKIPNGRWNAISPKLSSMYAASGSSVNIDYFTSKNGNIEVGLLIGGGGPKGASARRVTLKLKLINSKEVVMLSEHLININIPLPEGSGWGIYAMSEISEKAGAKDFRKEYFLGGGHWQFPDSDTITVWKLNRNNKLIPMNHKGYVSGILATGPETFAAVGTSKIQSGLPSQMPVSNAIQKSDNYIWAVGKQKLFYPTKRKDCTSEYNK